MPLWLWWWFTHSETLFHYFFIAVIASHAEIPAGLTSMTWIYPSISKSILKVALVSIVRLHLRMKRRHYMVTLATELRFLTCAPVPRGAERKSITREMEGGSAAHRHLIAKQSLICLIWHMDSKSTLISHFVNAIWIELSVQIYQQHMRIVIWHLPLTSLQYIPVVLLWS